MSDKYRFDRWGRLKIAAALRQRHIPDAAIRCAMEEVIDEDTYMQNLCDLIAKKAAISPEKDKILRFAASRGFEPHLIYDCID